MLIGVKGSSILSSQDTSSGWNLIYLHIYEIYAFCANRQSRNLLMETTDPKDPLSRSHQAFVWFLNIY